MNAVGPHFGPSDQRHAESRMPNDRAFLADLGVVQAHLILGYAEELLDRPAQGEGFDHFYCAELEIRGDEVGKPLLAFVEEAVVGRRAAPQTAHARETTDGSLPCAQQPGYGHRQDERPGALRERRAR